MTDSKHTPGPWKATRSNPAEGFDVWWITAELPNGEKEICSVPGGPATSEWNARLIAAAPPMLDALKAYRAAEKAQNAYEARCSLPGVDDRDEGLDDLGTFALELLATAREKRDRAIASAEALSQRTEEAGE